MRETRLSHEPHSFGASALLKEIQADDWGLVSVSVYETARVVSLVPWLTGHSARLDFLCAAQAPDGSWGEADGYSFVPTLSATEALLATLCRLPAGAPEHQRISLAASRGLAALERSLQDGADFSIPDTIAVEIIAPALIGEINTHLELLARHEYPLVNADSRLRLPDGITPASQASLRAALSREGAHAQKLWASLEAFGSTAAEAPFIRPSGGAVGCSPAATAAWLNASPERDPGAVDYLERLQARCGGPVTGVTPITYFEPAWALVSVASANLDYSVPPELLDTLDSGLGEYGAPAGPGLPPDSDDTAGVLYALMLHGRLRRPDSLLHFRSDGYFSCFPGERTPSTSTNAHVLEALGGYLAREPSQRPTFGPSVDMVATWLLDNQRADGSWQDKWHASAYYATASCVLALAEYDTARSAAAVARAVEWTLGTQREDG